ncbi:MAG: hypothetical protein KDI19_00355, partial [Pseudomonadales bacterium]|nr:hypothetical protein [Pseudomonadales bacterium]
MLPNPASITVARAVTPGPANVVGLLAAALLALIAPIAQAEGFAWFPHNVDPRVIIEVKQAIDDGAPVIARDLGIARVPTVNVHVWGDRIEFERAASGRHIETVARTPSFIDNTDGVPSMNLLHTDTSLRIPALHMLAHLYTLVINPEAQDNPRWLWESVALYESRDFHPPTLLSCITLSRAPTLGELNEPGSNKVEEVGYLMGEYIHSIYGNTALASLIRSGGDIKGTLDVSANDFSEGWIDEISRRYLQKNPIPTILAEQQIAAEVSGNTFYLEDGRSLYFAKDKSMYLKSQLMTQQGTWRVRGVAEVCW